MQDEEQKILIAALIAAIAGALVGISKLLISKETITLRLAIGRAITTAALSVSAFALLAWDSHIYIWGVVGLGVFAASLGESMIERILNKYLDGQK